jgi:hypothetical protein
LIAHFDDPYGLKQDMVVDLAIKVEDDNNSVLTN